MGHVLEGHILGTLSPEKADKMSVPSISEKQTEYKQDFITQSKKLNLMPKISKPKIQWVYKTPHGFCLIYNNSIRGHMVLKMNKRPPGKFLHACFIPACIR